MARVTLYTDKSKVGETKRAEAGDCYITEFGKIVSNLNNDSARVLAHFFYNPLCNKSLAFSVVQPGLNLL